MSLDLDLHRDRRLGFPEVVYAAGKTDAECVRAAQHLTAAHGKVLITRCRESQLTALRTAFPRGTAHTRSGCFTVGMPKPTRGPIAVVSAGTSDEPVAEEAELTARMRGCRVHRFADCGVSGIHRLARHLAALRRCRAVIVVAGFEGALPSVVGGLVAAPIIAVPTSVGYGAARGGETALCAMLCSCAPGVTVVNIDNGFGAGFAAARIASLR
ncbi:MAG: nickel pincer cofactor biosynthesis protein LarB [Planctomycetota bacterium]